MLPAPAEFARMVGKLGIGDGSKVVVYDAAGTAATRVWWMLRIMGHDGRGGARRRLAQMAAPRAARSRAKCRSRKSGASRPAFERALVRDRGEMLANVRSRREQVVDARAAARFAGAAPEPRPGLRAGHIPGAVNLPYEQLTEAKTGTFLPADDLAARLKRGRARARPGDHGKLRLRRHRLRRGVRAPPRRLEAGRDL